jgi:NhaP-type Na+/H+ or K+/H+ antiporter
MQQCLFAAIGIAPGDSPILIAVFGVLGGVGMGLTVGLVTGLFLVRLLDRAKPAV